LTNTPSVSDPEVVERLREVLLGARYHEQHLADELTGEQRPSKDGESTHSDDELPSELQAWLDQPELVPLIRLFWSGAELAAEEIDELLAPLDAERLEAAGVIVRENGQVRRSVGIVPLDGLMIAIEPLDPADPPSDVVTGVSPASATLGWLTERRDVETALDLGTGCGTQALFAARHARQVVGTDVNPRALEFAEFNSRLNGLTNIEWLEGSWFEPVEGRRFDLIVSNPPFVVSPESALVYRDSDMPGDAVSRHVVREAAAHLTEDGRAHVLVNWAHDREADWSAPLREWVADTGCDAILVHYGSEQPVDYATKWNQAVGKLDFAEFDETLRRWLDYYEEAGIERIATGAVFLRRRSGADNRARAINASAGPSGPAGKQVGRVVEGADLLAAEPTDEELLATVFEAVGGVAIEEQGVFAGGSYVSERAVAKLVPGLGLEVELSGEAADALRRCDGRRTLGALVAAATAGAEPSRDELADAAGAARELVEKGLLSVSKPA